MHCIKNLPIAAFDIGVLVDKFTYLPLRTVGNGADINERARLVVDLKWRSLQVFFQLPIFNPKYKSSDPTDIYQHYRVKIPFTQLTRIFQSRESESGCVSHLTCLDSPPMYHRRIKDIRPTFIDDSNWKDVDTWFRQTYVVHNQQELSTLPVSLRKLKPVIDIGEYYFLSFCTVSSSVVRPLDRLQDNLSERLRPVWEV